jgi:hypothetical protein
MNQGRGGWKEEEKRDRMKDGMKEIGKEEGQERRKDGGGLRMRVWRLG